MGAPAIREMAMKTPVEMEKMRKDVAVKSCRYGHQSRLSCSDCSTINTG